MTTETKTEGQEAGVEDLRQAARELNLDAERMRDEIEKVASKAAALMKRADASLGEYWGCINQGDKTGADRTLAEIKPLRAKAACLRSGVQPYIERLIVLNRKYTTLNVAIQSRFADEEALFKAAMERFSQARTLLGELGFGSLSAAKIAVERWSEEQGLATKPEDPEKQVAEDRDVIPTAKTVMPCCPRCRQNDDVEAVPNRAGRYRCRRAYHGPLTFDGSGAEFFRGAPGPAAKSDVVLEAARSA